MHKSANSEVPVCRVCTWSLEVVCDQRAWWFRPLRIALRTGIHAFSFLYRIDPRTQPARSPYCHGCVRFRKNALRQRSRVFVWLDGYLNPLINRTRDSLLTTEELAFTRALTQRFEDPAAHS